MAAPAPAGAPDAVCREVAAAGRIRVLDPEVAQRIAAGEVVERPASVVKELCDNAVDAGARRVRVDIAAGGTTRIAVTDDGCGMDREDVERCFLRHATSKLAQFDDLEALGTLGFRGEALPSIAAVSRVRLCSRVADADAASEAEVEGGGAVAVRPAAAAPGTRVEVGDLFFNTPARRAAMGSPGRERSAVVEAVTSIALARPDVAFHLWSEGREVLATPGDGQLLAAVVAVWGPDTAGSMLTLQGADAGWRLTGLCGTPAASRGHRGGQHVAVDGRPVRADVVRGAVESAYHNLLMGRRYPQFILDLRASRPGQYDPNVHPSKREVRVRHEQALRELCRSTVRAALRMADLLPGSMPALAGGGPAGPFGTPPGSRPPTSWTRPRLAASGVSFAMAAQAPGAAQAAVARESATLFGRDAGPQAALRDLLALGQVAAAYIVAGGPDGLYLVDQHAAHERVHFERLGRRAAPPSRPLVSPEPVALPPALWRRWEAAAPALAAAGFTTEPFGDGTVLLRAVPGYIAGDAGEALTAALEALEAGTPDDAARRLAGLACRAAVKAHEPLSTEEQQALLVALSECQEPFTCPHGRPTVVRLTEGDLARLFSRR